MQAPDILVTENLTSAMYFLGKIFPGTYWIDALCINQKDDTEKSNQVSLMREIYSTSKRVVVFLGLKDDGTDKACQLIGKLCELFQDGRIDLEGAAIQVSIPVARKYPFEDEKLRELGLPLTGSADWLALADFLSRTYFQRIWVLQELVMAPAGIICLCGSYQLPWAAFEIVHRVLVATNWRVEIGSLFSEVKGEDIIMEALEFVPIVTTLMHARKLELQTLLDMTRCLLATDPRDKIFALLGMADDEQGKFRAMGIRPDYGKSVQQVYTDLTGRFILNGSLELISSVECNKITRIKGLPSWVPDYNVTSHNGSFAKGYKAAGETSVSATWSPGSDVLKIKAYELDAVVICSDSDGETPERFLIEAFFLAAKFCSSGTVYDWLSLLAQGNSEPALDAFWRTLVGDGNTLNVGHPVPQEYQNHFATFMAHLFASQLFSVSQEATERLIAIPNSAALLTMGDQSLYRSLCMDKIVGHRFFITYDGRMGLASQDIEPGDRVMIFGGGGPIYLTRERQGYHQFIGNGYVFGLMHGEAIVMSMGGEGFKDIILK